MSNVSLPSRTSAWMMISLVILNPALATTVVVLRGPDYVILGADSRVTDVDGDQTGSSSTCKIRQFDNVYFALAGPAGDGRGFDVLNSRHELRTAELMSSELQMTSKGLCKDR
jgi:20S proteasome alpha/beta subunit